MTFLSATGRPHHRQSGVFSVSVGSMDVIARMEALSLDPTPISLQKEVQVLRQMIAISKPLWIDGAADVSLSAARNLSVTHCPVPTGSRVLFQVSVLIDREFEPGRAVADLASGDFGIRCPLVVVSVRGKPPPSILG